MKVCNRESGGMKGKIILLGIGLAAFFWIVNSSVAAFLFGEGTFVQQILASSPAEIWMRSVAVFTIIGFCAFIELFVINHRRTKEVRRWSEERYRNLADSLPQTLFETDEQAVLTFFNHHAFQTFGYTWQDFNGGLSVFELIAPGDRNRAREDVRRVLNGEKLNGIEYTALRKDGSLFPVVIFATAITDVATATGLRGVVIDITERKKAEDHLYLSSRLLDAATDLIFLHDLDGNLIYVNEAACREFGYSRNEFMHLNFRDLSIPEDEKRVSRALKHLAVKGDATFEITSLAKGGTTIPLEINARIVSANNGEHMLTVARDITERKKTQEQLQHSLLLASLGEMTAGIAHEVNNPLGSILLYSELLMTTDALPQTKRDLKVIHDEAKRAARIMTALLTYSRRERSRVRRLNLHRVLKTVLNMRRYEEKVQNIKVTTNLVAGPLYVKGDFSQLMQVFINIILNAEEALLPPNGGNIIITTQLDGEWAKVSIADDGTGIPPENLKQVFYPFFTTKQVGEGSGLGLSICYGIVTDHHGLIRAENNDMGGATFIVELPLVGATNGQESLPPETVRAMVATPLPK